MNLQLYQVDFKSYLLDFKSIPTIEDESKLDQDKSENNSSIVNQIKQQTPQQQQDKQKDPFENQSQCHHVIEFFEMCASLIKQLAH